MAYVEGYDRALTVLEKASTVPEVEEKKEDEEDEEEEEVKEKRKTEIKPRSSNFLPTPPVPY